MCLLQKENYKFLKLKECKKALGGDDCLDCGDGVIGVPGPDACLPDTGLNMPSSLAISYRPLRLLHVLYALLFGYLWRFN